MNWINDLIRYPVIFCLKMYKYCISPVLPGACRFTPTCSNYSIEAIERHGILKGLFLSVKRVLRCNPLCRGGYDPVP